MELLKTVGIECKNTTLVNQITCDSTKVKEHDLFVAIEGKNKSGYMYKEDVLLKKGWVVSERVDPDCFWVDDARSAYAYLIHAFYDQPALKLKMIGITGTNGKSTTAFMIRDMLENQGIKSTLIGTEGIEIDDMHWDTDNTTPSSEIIAKTLNLCIEKQIGVCIMEVSSMAIEMKRLVGCLFDILIYTNLSQDHLEEHGGLEKYYQAKKQAMELLKPKGVMIYNCDDEKLKEFASLSKNYCIPVGKSSNQFKLSMIECTDCETKMMLNEESLALPMIGEVNAYNCALALCAGFVLDLNWQKMLTWVNQCKQIEGRFEKIAEQPLIYIDYAHTERAMEQSLASFSKLKKGKMIVVFGCGGQRDKSKRAKMGQVACFYCDRVILTSDNPRKEDPLEIIKDIQKGCNGKEEIIINRKEAIKKAITTAQNSDIIILTGKGAEKTLVQANHHYQQNDKAIALEILSGEEIE